VEKEFIPYEQALALKELGFDDVCLATWKNKKQNIKLHFKYYLTNKALIGTDVGIICTAPLYQQAFRWFREKHGYFTSPTESDDDITKKYGWLITKNLDGGKIFINLIGYKDSYEEAELECLKKLKEIVKEK